MNKELICEKKNNNINFIKEYIKLCKKHKKCIYSDGGIFISDFSSIDVRILKGVLLDHLRIYED